jgi:hypothetical protein
MYLTGIKARRFISPHLAALHLPRRTEMPASRIVTVTPNPAVDMCDSVERAIPFHKLGCGIARRDPE